MTNKGHLFVISGPSGVGKSTIIARILEQRPELLYSISYTSRPKRGQERDGVDYHFISEAMFKARIDAGKLTEWAEVHGHLYGTSATFIEKSLTEGNDVVLDIDVEGAKKLLSKYPEAISIFVVPPTMKELQERLSGRKTDSPDAVERRFKNARAEMAQVHFYDHVLVNDDLAEVVLKLDLIIDGLVKSPQTDDTVKSSRCKARES
ncbi:MAG: guanylate kinase [Desulfobacterales bacterium S7086C20]|nr:MAG: guanylate kinase [Desulfobacterales bacterium S7086C20]